MKQLRWYHLVFTPALASSECYIDISIDTCTLSPKCCVYLCPECMHGEVRWQVAFKLSCRALYTAPGTATHEMI